MWRGENWSKVDFSDESKFNFFWSNGKHYVWHQTGERLNPKCIKVVLKRWRRKSQASGDVSAAGVGPLIVTGRTRRETCGSKCKLFIRKHGQYRQGRAVANMYGMGKTQE